MEFRTADELIDFLRRLAEAPSLEAAGFSELDHALQCASELERRRPGDEGLHIAGLVHDVGHTLGAGTASNHGRVGADAIRALLGERIATLVEGHIPAKRYLVSVDPQYRSTLSPVSIETLGYQGGQLTAEEIGAFEKRAHWADAVELRRADDAAKVPGRIVAGLDHWTPALRRLAAAH